MFCNWLRPMRRRVPPRAHKSSWRFRPDLEALEDRLAPAVALLVTSPGDAVAPDGVVTLREALLAANNNSTVNEAVHDGSGGIDTIRFDTAGAFATPQTIVLGGRRAGCHRLGDDHRPRGGPPEHQRRRRFPHLPRR